MDDPAVVAAVDEEAEFNTMVVWYLLSVYFYYFTFDFFTFLYLYSIICMFSTLAAWYRLILVQIMFVLSVFNCIRVPVMIKPQDLLIANKANSKQNLNKQIM